MRSRFHSKSLLMKQQLEVLKKHLNRPKRRKRKSNDEVFFLNKDFSIFKRVPYRQNLTERAKRQAQKYVTVTIPMY